MRIKKRNKRDMCYIPLNEIEKINSDFLDEMERVKKRLVNVGDKEIITAFQKVLLNAYFAAIEVKALESAVDYDIKYAEIEERRSNLSPWRRCWLWRLLFKPLTNRAQDIIEQRAELEADLIHTEAEIALESTREKLLPERRAKREIKRELKKKLEEVIEAADNSDVGEAFGEPAEVNAVRDETDVVDQEQPGEQLSLDVAPPVPTRKPRPPRSCRKA